MRTLTQTRWNGRRRAIDTDRYATDIPWRDSDDALRINGCELTTTNEQGQVLYRNSFATALPLDTVNQPCGHWWKKLYGNNL
ncbi:MAG: hypothetical protein WBJ41_12050 [Chromatiaceae bacterium]